MTNKFLLNLLGFNPDLTSRQSRVDSVSILSRQSDLLTYLGRIAAILLLVLTIGVGNVWGADATMTGVTNATAVTVNSKSGFKCATSKKAGEMKITVPSGATSISFYISGWGSDGTEVSVTPTGKVNTTSVTPSVDACFTGNGTTFTTNSSESTYACTITLKSITASTDITFSSGTGKRFIIWGATYSTGGGSTPSLTASPTSLDWGTVNKGASLNTKTFSISGSNLTSGSLSISASAGWTVSPTSQSVSGTLSSTDITVTPPSTATAGTKNGTITISGGGLASNVTVSCGLVVNEIDQFIDEVQSTSGYTSASPHVEAGSYGTTPSLSDKAVATSGTCEQQHYHFVGWITKTKYDAGTSIAVGDLQTPTSATGATYYAVWAKQASGSEVSDVINRALVVGANSNIGSNNNSTWATCTVTGSNSSAQYFIRSMGLNGATNYGMRWNTSGYLYCKVAPTSGLKLKSVTVTTTSNKNIGVYGSTSVYTDAPSSTSLGTLAATSSGVTYALTSAQLANNYTCIGLKGGTTGVEVVSITITYSSVSYTDYIAKCCTELGTINGSINMTSSTDGTVTVKDWGEVSNASSYTVRMYKLTAPSTWTIVSGSAASGASGSQGTRTGITNRSTGVTYSGLEYGETYKFTVQAIGTGSYCDGPETAVTSINGNSLTDNKFLNKYYIHIDDGTQSDSGWEDYYFTSLTSHAGSVDVTLNAFTDYYQYKLSLGGVIWWGNNSKMTSSDHTNWTLYTAHGNVKLQTAMGGTYTFGLNAATPAVTVTYPTSNQASGYHIYFDNSILEWSTLRYRIGNNSHNQNSTLALVTGTDNFYVATTPSYNGMEAWHIANNTGWADSHTIYRTATNNESGQPEIAITASIVFQQYKVTEDITVIPTTSHTTGTDNTGDKVNNQCEFYTINTPTSGMLTHTATISATTNGSINLAYTDVSGTSQNKTSTTSSLAHRTKITASAIPSTGYEISTFTVTPSGGDATNLTSGATDNHILAKDATFAATFSAKTYSIDLDREGATTGSTSVTMTYNSATHTSITSPSKDGYIFGGWWSEDNGTGSMVMNASGVLQENVEGYTGVGGVWTKDATCTLYAKWTEVLHNVTVAYKCGDATVKASTTINNVGITTTGSTTAPDINGYTWSTWSAMPSGVTTSTTPLTTKTIVINATADSKTITANYTANQYVVTLDANGGVDGATTSVTTTFGQAMPTIPTANLPTREGYRFDGFYTEKTDGTKYYNADGTSARNQARYSANQKLYAHWVAQLSFSINGVIDDELTRDDNTAMPSSAAVPAACGDCWAFAGWSTDSDEDGAPAYSGGATHEFGEPTTLYAVYGKTKYRIIKQTSDISADEYYVLTFDSIGVTPAMTYNITDTYYTTSENIAVKSDETGAYIEGPISDIVWKFTGTTSAGRFYNEAGSKYMDISDYDEAPVASSTSDYMTITVYNSSKKQFNIRSNTETSYYLQLYNKGWGVDNDHDGYYSARIFKRSESTYTTVPLCSEYTVTWAVDNDGGSAKGTTVTNSCQAFPSTIPSAPADNTLSCATKFMGWSASQLIGTGQSEPDDLFSSVEYAPVIDDDITFNAVFASVDTESEAPADITTTFTSTAWGDANSLWTSNKNATNTGDPKGVQVNKNESGAGATTNDSYNKVSSVVITYGSANSATGSIAVSVGETAMTLSEGSISAGQTDETLTYTPTTPATYLTGAVSFVVTVTNKSIYIKSIEINYTGYGYKDYMTSCCEAPTFTINGTGKTVTDGKISFPVLREDLGGASSTTWAELPITISSNSSGEITIINGSMPEGGGNIDNAAKTAWKLSAWESRAESGGLRSRILRRRIIYSA